MFTGYQLKEYRKMKGLTQEQLGLAVSMSRDAIAKIEMSNRIVRDIEMLKAFQRVLAIPYEIIGFIPLEGKKCH